MPVQAIEAMSALGVEDALVREHSPGRSLYDTGFTLTLLRGLLMALALASLAGTVADWFSEPRLTYVLYALAAGALIDGLGNIGMVEFRVRLPPDWPGDSARMVGRRSFRSSAPDTLPRTTTAGEDFGVATI